MRDWELTELARVTEFGEGHWPREFTWRGRRRRVRRIETYKPSRLKKDLSGASVARRFRLKTDDGLSCVLSHDVRRDRWTVERLFAT